MEETVKQLEELSEKYKRNNRLSKEDGRNAEKLLHSLFLSNEKRPVAYQYVSKIPAENVCNAFILAWQSLDMDGESLLTELIGNKHLSGMAGINRKVELLSGFIPLSQKSALILLKDLTETIGKYGRKKPNSRIVSTFRKKLMDNEQLLQVPLEDLNSKEISGLSAIVMMGLVEGNTGDAVRDSDWRMLFLKWLGSCGDRVFLSQKLTQEIEQETSRWPEKLQRECQQLGLIKTVVTHIAKGEPELPDSGMSQKIPAVTNNVIDDPLKGNIKVHSELDSVPKEDRCRPGTLRCLQIVADDIMQLENKLKNMEIELSTLKLEHEKTKLELNDRQVMVQELQKTKGRLETEKEELTEKLAMAQKKISELQAELEHENAEHAKKVDQLLAQMDRESEYNLQEFKNILSQTLYLQYNEYLEIKDEKMTENLGEHLRFMIRKIFRLLENKGVVFDEG